MGPKRGNNRGPKKNGGGQNPKPAGTAAPPERERLYSECDEDHCAVCLNRSKIFSVGICNHTICHECSTRMRVLCQQNECPICRQDLPKVIFTTTRQRYDDIQNNVYSMDKKYRICFENDDIKHAYDLLLQHGCNVCSKTLGSFKLLDQHMRREHQLFYCTLCVDHLKIFTNERKLYNRSDLATHRRKGDPDDSSHKGHPLCEFCDTRFVDNDELFRHLRKEHFFCHFCDADGQQFFFADYEGLRVHFRDDHFLCEEGNCKNEQFTSAFRTDIDLKAHRMERHANMLSKAEAKQNRTLGFEFEYTRPRGSDQDRRTRRGGGISETPTEQPPPSQTPTRDELLSAESFPSLGASANSGSSSAGNNSIAKKLAKSSGRNTTQWSNSNVSSPKVNLEEEFPSLPGSRPTTAPSQPPLRQAAIMKPPAKTTKAKQTPADDFPSLGGPSSAMRDFRPKSSTTKTAPDFQAVARSGSTGQQRSANNESSQQPVGQVASEPRKPRQEDFPGLAAPAKKLEFSKSNKENIQQKQIRRPPVQTSPSTGSSLKGSANLRAAADLISLEPRKKKTSPVSDEPTLDPLTAMSVMRPSKHNMSKLTKAANELSINAKEESAQSNVRVIHKVSDATPAPAISKKAPTKDDFPSLGNASKKMSANFGSKSNGAAPKWAKPPPGFNAPPAPSGTGTKAPPPGFKTKKKKVNAKYLQPPDFSSRNGSLVALISNVMGGKSLEFQTFKTVSGQFRSGGINSADYYDKCLGLVDYSDFMRFFPELLVLLPDIKMQQDLLSVHRKRHPSSDLEEVISACPVCDQVLNVVDSTTHDRSHDQDEDFPTLG